MKSLRALAAAFGALLLATVAVAAPTDLSGTWGPRTAAREGARRGRGGLSLHIDQSAEAVTLSFGPGSRMAMTVRTDGTPRPLKVNGNATQATIAAHWEGSDLVVEFTPSRPGVKPVRTVLRRIDETTLRIEGTLPGAGSRMATRGIDLELQSPDRSERREKTR